MAKLSPRWISMRDLDQYRDSPTVLVFQPSSWNPAQHEFMEAYNRLIASLPGTAGARLVEITADGEWQSLSFDDAAVSLAVIDQPAPRGAEFGLDSDGGVVVLDARGRVRWTHHGNRPAIASELARALSGAAGLAAHGIWSRREFVATAVGAALALIVSPRFSRADESQPAALPGSASANALNVTLNVNGRALDLQLDSRVTLLDALREYAGLTGTKKGCDHGQCGACTVHVDGRRTLSCLTLAVMAQGKKITTIEGLARGADLHPMQQAFIKHDGFQCGYCTCGQIMSATAMVDEPWGKDDDDVREAMSGNLCRCGAYPGIVAAIQEVRAQRKVAR